MCSYLFKGMHSDYAEHADLYKYNPGLVAIKRVYDYLTVTWNYVYSLS